MKKEIHPAYHEATVFCIGCSATFTTGSVMKELRVSVCSQCHPFYSGTQKMLDAEGRVDRFNRKYSKFSATKKEAAAA